jgi:CRISPR-associated endonuclease/helicase Cas3
MTFSRFVEYATATDNAPGVLPYRYQEQLAELGLPELLRVPTGAGKTLAAVLPWLWRLTEYPDPVVRASEANWLVYVLPMRALVEQTVAEVRGWLSALGMTDQIGLHVLMGGEDRDDAAWQLHPERSAVFVGTQDMVLSRLLMRGYGESRAMWPVSFGLLHNVGVQFVFDETQLMGPALPTSVQLQALRERFGTGAPSRTMWMSATLDPAELITFDRPVAPTARELPEEDVRGALTTVLAAGRQVARAVVPQDSVGYPMGVATLARSRHQPGTRTLVVLNQVQRAEKVYAALVKLARAEGTGPEVVLVHGHFRPPEREKTLKAACSPIEEGEAGRIVVSTQVLEAGVNVSSRVMLLEAASWSSVVQRAGRLNRKGEYGSQAELLWLVPPKTRGWALPYEEAEVEASIAALESLEGTCVTSTDLQRMDVEQDPPERLLLRGRDLMQLWDTMPDLTGSDVDVSVWIRDGDDFTGLVAWREWPDGRPGEGERGPARDELCPAPFADLQDWARERRLWVFDQVDGRWRVAVRSDVRPGVMFLADAADGGYSVATGWAPGSREPVPVLRAAELVPDGFGGDRDSECETGRWIGLVEHGEHVAAELERLFKELSRLSEITAAQREAAVCGALNHDLGKVHRVFQESLMRAAGEDPVPGSGPFAKSGGTGRLRHKRAFFRHELVSGLIMLAPGSGLLDGVEEADLAVYVAVAHHGKVRLAVRSQDAEVQGSTSLLLGVQAGEKVGPIPVSGGRVVEQVEMDLSVFQLGGNAQGFSWVRRVTRLLEREDLGPFRLALLEALVRAADRRVSAGYTSRPHAAIGSADVEEAA